MTTPRTLIARVREWLRRGRIERDLDDELQSHLDHLTDEHVRRGLDRDDARRAALREFGGVEQAREAVRDRRGFRPLYDVIHDLRYAVRLLIKAPGFTTAAILTLGLGIGANAAIFSLVDAVMFRPLPYREPAQLVAIWDLMKNTGADAAAGDLTRIVVSPANLRDYRRATNARVCSPLRSSTRKTRSGTGNSVEARPKLNG